MLKNSSSSFLVEYRKLRCKSKILLLLQECATNNSENGTFTQALFNCIKKNYRKQHVALQLFSRWLAKNILSLIRAAEVVMQHDKYDFTFSFRN